MLSESNAVAVIAVKDIGKARKFYESTLGLEAAGTEGEEVVTSRSDATVLNVSRSDYAGRTRQHPSSGMSAPIWKRWRRR